MSVEANPVVEEKTPSVPTFVVARPKNNQRITHPERIIKVWMKRHVPGYDQVKMEVKEDTDEFVFTGERKILWRIEQMFDAIRTKGTPS